VDWRKTMKPCPNCDAGRRPEAGEVERIELMPGVFTFRCVRCKGAGVLWPDTDPQWADL
jgi:hypothetical protein